MPPAILILNAGSSSLKFALYPVKNGPQSALLRGKVSGIGTNPAFTASDAQGHALPQNGLRLSEDVRPEVLIPALLDWFQDQTGGVTIRAAGHRVVHGGRDHDGPALLNDTVLAELETLIPLAPMHQPQALAAIRCLAAAAPDLPQVACFDTSFHRTQNPLAQMFALPRAMTDTGIIRYGSHGLSYEHIASTLPGHIGHRAVGRVIVTHLGNGASMCAMKQRRSVATSMGFTALDGLMMGQRCGSLDPGVVLYLMMEKGMSAQQVSTLLYEHSGLLGVSGISNDMAVLQASTAPEAQEAIALFCHRAAGELAQLATAIGGLDTIVFSAGIGENSAPVRENICNRLLWMGVKLDPRANDLHAPRIHASWSEIEVLIIPTDEEAVIAQATLGLTASMGVFGPS